MLVKTKKIYKHDSYKPDSSLIFKRDQAREVFLHFQESTFCGPSVALKVGHKNTLGKNLREASTEGEGQRGGMGMRTFSTIFSVLNSHSYNSKSDLIWLLNPCANSSQNFLLPFANGNMLTCTPKKAFAQNFGKTHSATPR